MLKLTKEAINNVDMSRELPYIGDSETLSYYHADAGKEHYKLLIYVSQELKPKLTFDVGTCRGASALALSNGSKKVVSYDIQDGLNLPNRTQLTTIEFIIGDVLTDDRLITSDLILLDAWHHGVFEKRFVNYLVDNDYKGILLLDDIHLKDSGLPEWWKNLKHPRKYDITKYGHGSGTGMLVFNDTRIKLG